MSEATVLVSKSGSLGHIVLNRPKALNALNLEMVELIDRALDDFEADPEIAAVLVSGAGERGFCAGGDIRAAHDSGKAGDGTALVFWRTEYRLNARIARFPKPYIAWMSGITMGGGVGLSAHGSHRIVTDTTRLAMPETGIGFFPDVGGSWLLSRPGSEFGTFMGLTGTIVGAGDAIRASLADFCVPSDRFEELRSTLSALPKGANATEVGETISRFAVIAESSYSPEDRALIDRALAHATIEEIISALAAETGDFARKLVETLGTRSPTSLKVTLRMIRLGRDSADLETCLSREYAALPAVLASHDFYEGVRAAVIDKDRNPKWQPATLAAVSQEAVDAYFPDGAAGIF